MQPGQCSRRERPVLSVGPQTGVPDAELYRSERARYQHRHHHRLTGEFCRYYRVLSSVRRSPARRNGDREDPRRFATRRPECNRSGARRRAIGRHRTGKSYLRLRPGPAPRPIDLRRVCRGRQKIALRWSTHPSVVANSNSKGLPARTISKRSIRSSSKAWASGVTFVASSGDNGSNQCGPKTAQGYSSRLSTGRRIRRTGSPSADRISSMRTFDGIAHVCVRTRERAARYPDRRRRLVLGIGVAATASCIRGRLGRMDS